MKVFIVSNQICDETLIVSVHRNKETAVEYLKSIRDDLIHYLEDLDESGSGTIEFWEVPESYRQEYYMIDEFELLD